jgi:hypothetical protein
MYTDVDADVRRSARVVPCTVSDATCAMALSVISCCDWERRDRAVVRSAEDNMLGGAEGCVLRCEEVEFNFCVGFGGGLAKRVLASVCHIEESIII